MSIMGERIRNKRIENGLSMEELGQRLGVQRAAVSKWESGKVDNIRIPTIKKMADLFRCSPSWLMGASDEEKLYTGVEYFVDFGKDAKDSFASISPERSVSNENHLMAYTSASETLRQQLSVKKPSIPKVVGPIIGPASKRAELYQAALNVKEENIDVAIDLLKSLS